MIRKYRKLPVEIEAMTFDEMLAYASENALQNDFHSVDGVPWSFIINNYQVTHEDNDNYIITTLEGNMKMTREDMLIIGVTGEIYPCKIDIFKQTYEVVNDS